MFWNSIKWPIVLAAMLGLLGIGAATTAQQGTRPPKPTQAKSKPSSPPGPNQDKPASRKREASPFDADPQPAQKRAEMPADDDEMDFAPNLPWDAFPEVKDDDAPAKILAAQQAYDQQLASLTRESGEAAAEVEILQVEMDVLKQELTQLLQLIRQRKVNLSVDPNAANDERTKRDLEITQQALSSEAKSAHVIRSEIQSISVKQQEAQRRSEEIEDRLRALKKRPRPVERLEVQPGDILRVEVLEALPGRPITGEHVVRADGMLSLGFYGKIYVTGLTPEEIKEKVILKLRRQLPDQTLGLVELVEDEKTGKMKLRINQPRDSDRAYVDLILQPR